MNVYGKVTEDSKRLGKKDFLSLEVLRFRLWTSWGDERKRSLLGVGGVLKRFTVRRSDALNRAAGEGAEIFGVMLNQKVQPLLWFLNQQGGLVASGQTNKDNWII